VGGADVVDDVGGDTAGDCGTGMLRTGGVTICGTSRGRSCGSS
jgi:hypothetical protein